MTSISVLIQGRESGSSGAKAFVGMKEGNIEMMVEGSLLKFETCQSHHLSLLIQSSLLSPDLNFAKDVLSKALCFIVSKSDVRYIDEKENGLVSRCL